MGHKAKQTFKALHKGKGDFVSLLFSLRPGLLKTIIFQVKLNKQSKQKTSLKAILYLKDVFFFVSKRE